MNRRWRRALARRDEARLLWLAKQSITRAKRAEVGIVRPRRVKIRDAGAKVGLVVLLLVAVFG